MSAANSFEIKEKSQTVDLVRCHEWDEIPQIAIWFSSFFIQETLWMILMDLILAAVSTWHPPNLHRPHLDSSSPNQSFQTSTFHNKKTPKVTKICSPATNQSLNPKSTHIYLFFIGVCFPCKNEPNKICCRCPGLVRNFSRWQKWARGGDTFQVSWNPPCSGGKMWLETPFGNSDGWIFSGKTLQKSGILSMGDETIICYGWSWWMVLCMMLRIFNWQACNFPKKLATRCHPFSDVHLRCQKGEMFSWTAMILCPIWRCKSCWFVLSNHQF